MTRFLYLSHFIHVSFCQPGPSLHQNRLKVPAHDWGKAVDEQPARQSKFRFLYSTLTLIAADFIEARPLWWQLLLCGARTCVCVCAHVCGEASSNVTQANRTQTVSGFLQLLQWLKRHLPRRRHKMQRGRRVVQLAATQLAPATQLATQS